MDKSFISFDVSSSSDSDPLSISVLLNQGIIYENHTFTGQKNIRVEIPDDQTTHSLQIVLAGKTAQHTVLDNTGNIIQDVTVAIENLKFDDISASYNIMQLAVYDHDFNGTADAVRNQFFGIMGCNGTVTLEFTTPIYLWLLENM